jgi:hypothetical protein
MSPGRSVAAKSDMGSLAQSDAAPGGVCKPAPGDEVAVERAHARPRDLDGDERADKARRGLEDGDAVAPGPTGEASPGLVGALDEDLLHGPDERLAPPERTRAQHLEEHPVALLAHRVGHLARIVARPACPCAPST